jgi:hypothetical protein
MDTTKLRHKIRGRTPKVTATRSGTDLILAPIHIIFE